MSKRNAGTDGDGGLPDSLARWLEGLGQGAPTASLDSNLGSLPRGGEELVRKAALCYARAGWPVEAALTVERLGDHEQAGRFYEQVGRWVDAALSYERAGRWEEAARCWLRGDRPEEAAASLRQAGRIVEAAWLLADRVGRHRQAEALIRDATIETPLDRAAADLVLARCEAARRLDHGRSASRLLGVLKRLPGLTDSRRLPLFERALIIAAALSRPDLAALAHAAAVNARLPDASTRWDEWSRSSFGAPIGQERFEASNKYEDRQPAS